MKSPVLCAINALKYKYGILKPATAFIQTVILNALKTEYWNMCTKNAKFGTYN